jgi:flagellar motility protein MotE (MotC chaperone)
MATRFVVQRAALQGVVLVSFVLCQLARARADSELTHPYCERVSARAHSDATLLWAPRLALQGLRYPSGIDLGPATASGFQLRVGLSYSLIDPLRALRTYTAADADCAVEQARAALATALESALELAAHRAQAHYLTAHQPEIDALIGRARTRLSQRLITVFELNQILEAAELLERKAARASGSAAQLEAASPAAPSAQDAHALAAAFVQRRSEQEQSLSALRTLDAWNVRLQGGVIPVEGTKLDWYGWLELSYSLGGPFQYAAESRYRQARQEELRSDAQQLPAKLQRQARVLHAQTEQATMELRVVEKRLAHLQATLAELTLSDPSASSHARDALTLAQLSADSERVFLQKLLESLAHGG